MFTKALHFRVPQSANVEEEGSTNYEFGFRFVPSYMNLELLGFYSDYSNILGTCALSSGCSAEDLDRSFNGGQALYMDSNSNSIKKFHI